MKAQPPAAARSFAKISDRKAWREYRSTKDLPELDNDGGVSAQYWAEKDGTSSAVVTQPGEDFWIFTRYCFDGLGQLKNIGFEIRTAWGWGYRLDGSMNGNALHPDSRQFFDTSSEKPISSPAGASDIPEALRPTLYLKTASLPFVRLRSYTGNPTR